MQLKVNHPTNMNPYSEVWQPSPIRWRLLFKDGDTFTTQSYFFKCKDYMNDVVHYLKYGKKFSVYGFNNDIQVNDDFVYVEVKDCGNSFEENLGYLNLLLEEEFKWPDIQVFTETLPEDMVLLGHKVLMVPRFYWTNTFYVALIFSLMRSCSYNTPVKTLDAFSLTEPTLKLYMTKIKTFLQNHSKEAMDDLTYVCVDGSGKKFDSVHNVHNAGFQQWIQTFEYNKGVNK